MKFTFKDHRSDDGNAMNNLMSEVVKAANNAEHEILKKLLLFAGINSELINKQNITEIKQELELRGYEINVTYEGQCTSYNLLKNGKAIATIRGKSPQFINENGDSKITIKYELIKPPQE